MRSHVGKIIGIYRKKRGFSLPEFAERIGVATEEVKWWENTGISPDKDKLGKVAEILNLPASETSFLDALPDFRQNLQPKLDMQKSVYATSLGKLYQADCIHLLRAIESRSVDCVFADPPFNLGKQYESKINDELDEEDYLDWTRAWIDEVVRVLKYGGSFFLYNLPKWNLHFAAYLSNFMTFRHWITVDIKFSLPIAGRLYPSHYSLLYFVKGSKANVFRPPRLPLQVCRHCGGEIKDYGGYKNCMNPKGINLTDVWTDIPPVRHRKYKNRGSNELSLKLLDRILDIATVENDVVLDPFGGSGTTYAACELKSRRWIGCEIGDCSLIVDRLSDLAVDRKLFKRIQSETNILFTQDALKLRKTSGYTNSAYRIQDSDVEQPAGSAEEKHHQQVLPII